MLARKNFSVLHLLPSPGSTLQEEWQPGEWGEERGKSAMGQYWTSSPEPPPNCGFPNLRHPQAGHRKKLRIKWKRKVLKLKWTGLFDTWKKWEYILTFKNNQKMCVYLPEISSRGNEGVSRKILKKWWKQQQKKLSGSLFILYWVPNVQ